jgi:peptidoglycan/xylan/chitin deacetylase (PgdA/CDA1 family)
VTDGTSLTRRRVLLGLAATAALVGVAKCSTEASGQVTDNVGAAVPPAPAPDWPVLAPPPPASARVPLPGGGVLSVLPGPGDLLAITLDDGVDTEVVGAYAQFAKDSGIRLTMFVTGVFASWADNRGLLAPLVESGQIQLANHTWIHPDLTTLTGRQVADELRHNDDFLRNTFGVDATPYFRPPYGAFNDTVTKVAADLGYTVTTLWNGNLGDDAVLPTSDIIGNAEKYCVPGSIVIGHLNHSPVTRVYREFIDVIHARNLRTVTLDDVFTKPEVTRLTSEYPS